MRHLIQAGHRKIAIITGPLKLQTGRERLRGYEDALREADIKVDPDLIFEGDFREESGYRLSKELLRRRRMRAGAKLGHSAPRERCSAAE